MEPEEVLWIWGFAILAIGIIGIMGLIVYFFPEVPSFPKPSAQQQNIVLAENVTNTTMNETKEELMVTPVLVVKNVSAAPVFKYVPSWTADSGSGGPCYHGVNVTVRGKTICTRGLSGEELRNYTAWLKNETAYNLSQGLPNYYNQTMEFFAYFRDNCTRLPVDYVWDGTTFIVNSSHPLSCPEIKSWLHNDGFQ